MVGQLGPASPGCVMPPACRQAERGSRDGNPCHPHPMDKGRMGCPVTRAWEPGPDAGLRARVVERGAAERCGKAAVPSWNSRRGGARGSSRPAPPTYTIHCDVHAHSTPKLMVFRYVADVAVPGLIPVPDPRKRGRCWTWNLPNTLGSRGGAGRVGVRDGRGAGTEVHGKGTAWGVLPIPLQGALAMCASGTASTRLKQCR